MPEKPDHLAFEQRRASALAGAADDLAGCLVDGKEIGAVDRDAGQAKTGSTVDIAVDGRRVIDGGRLGIAIVLDDKK
jgi:hypothetical protein